MWASKINGKPPKISKKSPFFATRPTEEKFVGIKKLIIQNEATKACFLNYNLRGESSGDVLQKSLFLIQKTSRGSFKGGFSSCVAKILVLQAFRR